jgi:hypothetical protein
MIVAEALILEEKHILESSGSVIIVEQFEALRVLASYSLALY